MPAGLLMTARLGVFVDDVERDVFGSGLERDGMRIAGDDNLLAATKLERGFGMRAV